MSVLAAGLFLLLPFLGILAVCAYAYHVPPDARARVIATKIMLHPLFPPQDLYTVHSAVLDLDITYLRSYLKALGPT